MESETWFEMLLGYCRMIREDTPPEQICSEGCEAREQFMAGRLKKKAAEVGEEGLVLGITGGFHTPALAEYLREQTKLKEWKEQAKRGRRAFT